MLRSTAVKDLLVQDVAAIRVVEPVDEESRQERQERLEEALEQARNRALLAGILTPLALALLFLFRDESRPFLPLGLSEDGLFSLVTLLVAAFAGFRLAQFRHLSSVLRVCRDLGERDGSR